MTTVTAVRKVWFITGASRGFGQLWALAALARGDKVAATARDVDSLQPLVEKYGTAVLPLQLDVTDREAVFAAVAQVKQKFDRIDVILSNAGYGHQGAVEEISESEAREQMDTNFFGTMWVAQATLPILRAQKSGHLLAVSSVLGVFSAPTFGMYSASKFALEGLFEAMSQEVGASGIKVTLIEPAGYATDFNNPSSAKYSDPIPAYNPVRDGLAKAFEGYKFGDPSATAAVILKVVDAPKPPLRIALGASAVDEVSGVYKDKLATWEAWRAVSASAQGN